MYLDSSSPARLHTYVPTYLLRVICPTGDVLPPFIGAHPLEVGGTCSPAEGPPYPLYRQAAFTRTCTKAKSGPRKLTSERLLNYDEMLFGQAGSAVHLHLGPLAPSRDTRSIWFDDILCLVVRSSAFAHQKTLVCRITSFCWLQLLTICQLEFSRLAEGGAAATYMIPTFHGYLLDCSDAAAPS